MYLLVLKVSDPRTTPLMMVIHSCIVIKHVVFIPKVKGAGLNLYFNRIKTNNNIITNVHSIQKMY